MQRVRLPSKPSAELAYSLFSVPAINTSSPGSSPPRLIVFLNNLLMPASSWETPIALLNQQRITTTNTPSSIDKSSPNLIPILTYDRYGQGASTDRDPLDSRPTADAGYGHDFSDVVSDLHSLIAVLSPKLFPNHSPPPDPQDISLLLVGASIGAPLARLYASTYPRTVAGAILLDSNIANANYSSFWPDPSAPAFDPADVIAPDCTLDQFLDAAQKLAAIFDLDVKNAEGLDRRNTPDLLPHAELPRLLAPGKREVLTKVMVVAHDPVAFADEGFERMGTPRSFTARWTQTAWDRYNKGLLQLGDSAVLGAVRVAKGCGHFIQRDDPVFVAGAVGEMLDVLGW